MPEVTNVTGLSVRKPTSAVMPVCLNAFHRELGGLSISRDLRSLCVLRFRPV